MSDDRAQAFTLEGFIAAVLILTAVLFALQSSVLTPTTTGSVDRSVQADVRQQAEDVLATSAESGNLSWIVRHWKDDCSATTFAGANSQFAGYGAAQPPTHFGEMLNETFEKRGKAYNVIAEYQLNASQSGVDAGDTKEQAIVRRGGNPPATAVVATYTITLYDDQVLTAGDDVTLPTAFANCKSQPGGFPIPDAAPDSPVYNVVEVRIEVWS